MLAQILFWWNAATLFGMLVAVSAYAAGLIERSQRALAEERHRAEQLLKQEISHQVAERSRAMSETLAQAGVAFVGAHIEPGRTFADRYIVLRALGRGGMGAVYEVERVTDRQRLALKVITSTVSGPHAARFAREAEIGARVRHANLVQIVDVGISAAGAPYLVMELVEGKSLEELRDQFGQKEWALRVLNHVALGLNALHEAGVVHRDLKPGNVLVSGEIARISDFGISRFGVLGGADPLADTAQPDSGLKGHSLTKTGALIGTPLYMAPEAARGGQAVDKPADVYAFGLMAYEMLSGRPAFESPPVLEILEGRSVPPVPPLAVMPKFDAWVLRCLETEPAARPSIRAMVEALDQLR